jgi:hypothetical protein
MNTDTARIYEPDEFNARNRAARRRENLDAHQAEFEAAMEAGKIVPVSEEVVRIVKAGKAEAARKAKRKAARAARKKNR